MPITQSQFHEKTLFDVLHDIWQARFYMLVCLIITLICAFIFLSLAQNFYRATMIIAPAEPLGNAIEHRTQLGEGSIQIQPGTLKQTSAFVQFEHIYNGPTMAALLLQNKSIIDALAFDRTYEFSKSVKTWSAENLSAYLKKRVILEPVSGTSLRRLTYLHPQKEFARTMISEIHRLSDGIIRTRTLNTVNERISYLGEAINGTIHPDHKRTLTLLLMEQERLKMMLSLNQPFAATIIEPPSISAKPYWPNPYTIYPIFILLGLFIGFVIYGLRNHGRSET